MLFAKIIPLLRLPRSLGVFDYQIPTELKNQAKIGDLVEVMFRGKKTDGIAVGAGQKPDIPLEKIKPILKLRQKKIVNKQQVSLVELASQFYGDSPALFYRMILPKIPQKKMAYRGNFLQIGASPLFLNKNIAIEVLSKTRALFASRIKNHFIEVDDLKTKIFFYLKVAEAIVQKKKQLLILVSQVDEILEYLKYFNQYFPGKICVFGAFLTDSEYRQNWFKILNNEAPIIIGTRLAIFAPFSKLGAIIIDNCHQQDFKQYDQNPRYDARRLASKLALQIPSCKLIFCDSLPTVDIQFQNKNKKIRYHQFSQIRQSEFSRPLKIIPNNLTAVADAVYSPLQKKQKAIIFLNRRGEARFIMCRDCHYVFRCPVCQTGLATVAGKLYCLRCRFKKEIPLNCPKCKGLNIHFSGIGIVKLSSYLKEKFPQARIICLSKDDFNSSVLLSDFDILIATDMFWKKCWEIMLGSKLNIGFFAILGLDFEISLPDLENRTEILIKLKKIYSLANKYSAELIIQTQIPEHSIFQALNDDVSKFYDSELSERKKYKYPPYYLLIKLIYRNQNQKLVDSEAEMIYNKLLDYRQKNKNIEISEPYSSYPKIIRGQYQKQILIQMPKADNDTIKLIPENWIIDVEPISIL